MDVTPDTQVDDLALAVASIDELLRTLGLDRSAIDIDKISHETGIPVERVHGLLNGAAVEPEDVHEIFQKRLVFLRSTRLKPDGKQYTLDEIGAGADMSHGAVGYLLKGKRSPGLGVLAKLESFFEVEPGFFTATERQAMLRALGPIHDQLTHLALLRGKGISQLAMRSSAAVAGDSKLGLELREALTFALSQPESHGEDPEVAALTEKVRALPSRSRKRILPVIWSLLGLVRPDEDGPETGPSTKAS